MSAEIDKLDETDREILLRAPAIVALLAAISDDGEVSKSEKSESVKLAHLRTYTSHEILHNFYKEVDKVFEGYFDEEAAKMPDGKEEREKYLEGRLTDLNEVLPKLNKIYANELVLSLKSFARHVFKSNAGYLEFFVLPIFLNKIDFETFNPKIGGR